MPKKYNTQPQSKSSTVAKVAQIMALLNKDESGSDIDSSETSEDEGFHFDYMSEEDNDTHLNNVANCTKPE